jgi:hypothetical protein
MIYNNSKVFDLASIFLKSRDINFSSLIKEIYALSTADNFLLKKIFNEFLVETKAELFNSQEECVKFYSKPDVLEKVKNGEVGNNLIFKYLSITLFEYWPQAVEVLLSALNNLTSLAPEVKEDLSRIFNAQIVNISETPMEKNISFKLKSSEVTELLKTSKASITMKIKDKQYEDLLKAKNIYANNRVGWSLILANYRVQHIIRDIITV